MGIVSKALEAVVGTVAAHITKIVLEGKTATTAPTFDITKVLGAHLQEVGSWASRIQMYGMPQAQDLDSGTIELNYYNSPRRFRASDKSTLKFTLDGILAETSHSIVLGDPGAGKTTSLKQMARKVLTDSAGPDGISCQYPILVRLREVGENSPLYSLIGKALGLPIEARRVQLILGSTTELFVGNRRVSEVIPIILSDTQAMLILDGLDEVPSKYFNQTIEDLERLGRQVNNGRIICSARSGAYEKLIEGFDVYEVAPLDCQQIEEFAKKRVVDFEEFLRAIREVSYRDQTSRPLILAQLAMLYNRSGGLPAAPYEVTRRVVRLLLEEWDQQNSVRRGSKYSDFGPERKHEFLAALAYQLSYIIMRHTFTGKQLIDAYGAIYRAFNLPFNEAEKVARELESHTGILCAASDGFFEFSHLSIQEFLCADYLVRNPFSEYLPRYLAQFPGPVAIAVSMSSDSGVWLAHCFLDDRFRSNLDYSLLGEFLRRLEGECSIFAPSAELGVTVLHLLIQCKAHRAVMEVVERLAYRATILEAVGIALGFFCWVDDVDPDCRLIKRASIGSETRISTPEGGLLSKVYLASVLSHCDLVEHLDCEGRKVAYPARPSSSS